jgi:hypothetical protein
VETTRVINPKFRGISFFRKKAIPKKIFAAPRRMVKRSAGPVKPTAVVETTREYRIKQVESVMKKIFCRVSVSTSLAAGRCGYAAGRLFDLPEAFHKRKVPSTKLPIR